MRIASRTAALGYLSVLRVVCCLALLLVLAPPVLAESEGEDGYAMGLWNGLMSPYCPGRVLIDCPSPNAEELRDWIGTQEAAGVPRAEVERVLYERFGDQILQAPRASGFGWIAYVVPALAVLAGAAIVTLFFRRRKAGPPAKTASANRAKSTIDPDIERAIDREMSEGA